jgi:glycosyltransferase involved in cell wall biosynthesis
MKLGVAIPCYKYHIPTLKRCLDAIEKQIIKPEIVIVSCSSCVREDIPDDYYNYSFPLEILLTTERQNASQNRNVATRKCIEKGMDFISYIDCDDEMHPQRIELLKKCITSNPECEFIVHSFLEKEECNNEFEIIKKPRFFFNILKRNDHGYGVEFLVKVQGNKQALVHHSQSTISKNLFNHSIYNESKSCERYEDSFFCADCFLKNSDLQTIYIYETLSKYYPEGKTVY